MTEPGQGPVPEKDVAPAHEKERRERIEELAREMEEGGWQGSPLVVNGDQVLSGAERYEAARFLGREDEVPTVTLEELFAEAGMDMPQISTPAGEEPGADQREFFEDYLRDLPRHVRDKYGI